MKIKKRKEEINMKKLVSLFLALALVFSLTISASAERVKGNVTFGSGGTAWGNPNESYNIVEIAVLEGSKDTVYQVTVDWTGLTFSYKKAAETWDPATHEYAPNGTANWVDTDDEGTNDVIVGTTITRKNVITVKNHSNAGVNVAATFANGSDTTVGTTNTGVSAVLAASGATTLSRADEGESYGDVSKAPAVSYQLAVTGTPTADETEFGTITVTITAVPNP